MRSWKEIIEDVLSMEAHEDLVIPKSIVPNPAMVGFIETFGENQGQMTDYEFTLSDGRRIHVREYEDCYKAHWDMVSPIINPIEHLRRDAPHWWKIILAGISGIIGYLRSRRVEDAIIWAMLGYVVGEVTAET